MADAYHNFDGQVDLQLEGNLTYLYESTLYE